MKLAIYGTGGSGKEAYEILEECPAEKGKWEEIIFIDDTKEEGVFRGCTMVPFEAFKTNYSSNEIKVVIAVGEPILRKALYDKVQSASYQFANIIHESAHVSESAKLGAGIVLQSDVRVSSEAVIHDNVYINHRTIIGHDVLIEKHCQISCNVVLAGGTVIGEGVFIGIAAGVRDHIHVDCHSIISMGAVVLKDVRPYKIVMGNPGRETGENTEQKVFK